MTDSPHARSAIALTLVFALVPIAAVAPGRADETTPAAQAAQTQPAPPAGESPHELFVTVGKSLIVNSIADIERVSVGYGDVAEATAVGPREILVNGKAPGETSLIIWQEGGAKLFFDLTVRASTTKQEERVDTVRREIKKELADQPVDLTFENDTVFLRGHVKDLVTADRALAIAGTLGKTVNLLYVDVPGTEDQILLRVQFATIDRSVVTDLGLNLVSTGATNTIGTVNTGQFSPPRLETQQNGTTQITLSDALNIFLLRRDINLAGTIRALQTRGLVEILAEPNVLAINGKPASFVAGGEFPYPIVQGGGTGLPVPTIQFKEFGVRLGFVPLITPLGTIKLDVAPEVSALDFAQGLTFQGFNIPALTKRQVHTQIELESGQSFAIGGLLDRRLTETLQKIPLLADIPLLGKIFRSRALRKDNIELLVIVTPERVRPIPEGQKPPSLDMPAPLWGPDQLPRTPGMSVTGPVPTKSAPPMPMEKLIQSQKAAETALQQGGAAGTATAPGAYVTPMTAPAAPPVAPAPIPPPK